MAKEKRGPHSPLTHQLLQARELGIMRGGANEREGHLCLSRIGWRPSACFTIFMICYL